MYLINAKLLIFLLNATWGVRNMRRKPNCVNTGNFDWKKKLCVKKASDNCQTIRGRIIVQQSPTIRLLIYWANKMNTVYRTLQYFKNIPLKTNPLRILKTNKHWYSLTSGDRNSALFFMVLKTIVFKKLSSFRTSLLISLQC